MKSYVLVCVDFNDASVKMRAFGTYKDAKNYMDALLNSYEAAGRLVDSDGIDAFVDQDLYFKIFEFDTRFDDWGSISFDKSDIFFGV